MESPLSVGFVGLGIMGAPMAMNLLEAGFTLSVHNRTRSRCVPFEQRGAFVCDSPGELASRSNVVITMLSDTPDVEAVLFGDNGLAPQLRSGCIVIDMSTISPRATMIFSERLSEQEVSMLDAPVSGGESGAIAGTLSIMVGGDQNAFERSVPLLEALGGNIIYAGNSGSGQKTKLVNQVIGALNLLATVEGLRMASAAKLDLERTMQAVSKGAAGSWMLSNLGPKITAGDFRPGFAIRLQQKDLRLAVEFLRELGLESPGADLVYALFTVALQKGLGESGNQALFQV